MKIHGTINQLETFGGSYLNIINKDMEGFIGVWGSCYKKPTILIKDGQRFELIQFDNEACFEEWMYNNVQNQANIMRLFVDEIKMIK